MSLAEFFLHRIAASFLLLLTLAFADPASWSGSASPHHDGAKNCVWFLAISAFQILWWLKSRWWAFFSAPFFPSTTTTSFLPSLEAQCFKICHFDTCFFYRSKYFFFSWSEENICKFSKPDLCSKLSWFPLISKHCASQKDARKRKEKKKFPAASEIDTSEKREVGK